jgi:hypothetical protein
MKAVSEQTFGKKIADAQTLATHLQSFTTYNPPAPQLSAAELQSLINSIIAANNDTATALQDYSLAVEDRQQAFFKAGDSVEKIVTPIVATIRAKYGKDAKETTDIARLTEKIRGPKYQQSAAAAKQKAQAAANNEPAPAVAASRSERSYGSITKSFSDMVAMLQNLGTEYAPANTEISVTTLQQKIQTLNQLSAAVDTSSLTLKAKRTTRDEAYTDLKERCIKIKEAVKAQFGINSVEYRAIKGLKV